MLGPASSVVLAQGLAISQAAAELYLASDVIDLHVDSFIWHRLGYDLRSEHQAFTRGAFLSQVDFPRIRRAGLTGATWIVTTNPMRSADERVRVFEANVRELRALFESAAEDFSLVSDYAGYLRAKSEGRHAAFIGVQGGAAFDGDFEVLSRLPPGSLLRVTLVHLTNSSLGATSAPRLRFSGDGLKPRGIECVRRLETERILVDLAHASERTFWDVVRIHDKSKALVVTHTGVSGVHPHWRDIDDAQIRAISESGGVVGIMYHSEFLGDRWWSGKLESIVRHLEHVLDVGGEDAAALGSDWDGMIVTPRDMQTCLELPRLVECMLRRGWREERVRKVLGQNFLRVLRELRAQ